MAGQWNLLWRLDQSHPAGSVRLSSLPPARGALGRLDEDTYCAALQPAGAVAPRAAREMTTNTNSLPGLNEAGNERRLGFVDGVVDGGTVAGVQDLHSEDAHCGCRAHFVGAAEGHVEGQDLIGIPRGSCFFKGRHFRDRQVVQLVDGSRDIRAGVADQVALEDRGLVGLEQRVLTEGRADVIGVSDELATELVDQAQERIAIEVDPDQQVYRLAPATVLLE